MVIKFQNGKRSSKICSINKLKVNSRWIGTSHPGCFYPDRFFLRNQFSIIRVDLRICNITTYFVSSYPFLSLNRYISNERKKQE